MKLSKELSINPCESWVIEHNNEVRSVLEAYENDCPIRVPLISWAGNQFYIENQELDYIKYYKDPNEMLRVQLEASKRKYELPISDTILGKLPERWEVSVDFWNVLATGWVGCQLIYRDDGVVANHRLNLNKKECDDLEMPDPVNGGILKTINDYYNYLKEKYEGKLYFLERPVEIMPVSNSIGTHGFFCLALEIRGPELMLDMYEDPDFAYRFLRKIANWIRILLNTWIGEGTEFMIHDHGIEMLSPELYEQFIVPIIKEMNQIQGTTPPTNFHHCGRAVHLFPIVKKHFNINCINCLTYPSNDVVKVRSDLGNDVELQVIIEDSIVQQGPPERIRQVVKNLMQSGIKEKGRQQLIIGDLIGKTPLDNVAALYNAVKEFGKYL